MTETLIILVLSPLVLMIFHIVFLRLIHLCKLDISNQLSLVLSMLFLNIPLLAGVYFLNHSLFSLVYAFIIYNCLAYSYFHFFNMSETARRIKILLEIRHKKYIVIEELTKHYKPDFMVKTRLKRLLDLKQIKQQDGKYFLIGKTLLFGAILVRIWRKVLSFE
ncbi:MAG: Membrane protein [uncultured bacterium]|nr:MAG: Membrane protein [uncultured bacterium]